MPTIAIVGAGPGLGLALALELAPVARKLQEHEDLLALQRLRRNKQLTEADLAELERILIDAGIGDRRLIAAAAEGAATEG